MLKNIGLLILSIFFSLLLGEGITRILSPQELMIVNRREIWRPDSLTGWRHVENAHTMVHNSDRRGLFITDKNGFRVGSKNDNRNSDVTVLMIGDSFLASIGFAYEETIPGVLEQLLETRQELDFRIISDGVNGWCPRQYYLETKRLLEDDNFDLAIIFIYVANDFMNRIDTSSIKPRLAGTTRKLGFPRRFNKKQIKKCLIGPVNDWFESWSHLFVLLKKRSEFILSRVGMTGYYFPEVFLKESEQSSIWENTAEMCLLIAERYRAADIPVIFVMLPAIYQVDDKIFNKYLKGFDISEEAVDLQQPNRLFAESLTKRSLKLVDPLEYMRQKKSEGMRMYGFVDRHFDLDGHRVVADYLVPFIEDELAPVLENRLVDKFKPIRK